MVLCTSYTQCWIRLKTWANVSSLSNSRRLSLHVCAECSCTFFQSSGYKLLHSRHSLDTSGLQTHTSLRSCLSHFPPACLQFLIRERERHCFLWWVALVNQHFCCRLAKAAVFKYPFLASSVDPCVQKRRVKGG